MNRKEREMHLGRVFGGQAEKSQNKQKPPWASKTCQIKGMLVKSCILEGFWTAGLKPRKVSKTTHCLPNHTKLKECYCLERTIEAASCSQPSQVEKTNPFGDYCVILSTSRRAELRHPPTPSTIIKNNGFCV